MSDVETLRRAAALMRERAKRDAFRIAVADWLDLGAETLAFETFMEARNGSHVDKNIRAALAVANAYLGEE